MPRKNITKVKLTLIASFGGACQRCGYSRCLRALHFHHTDASEKYDWPGTRGHASLDEVGAHPERFLLLCANCHAEEEEALYLAQRIYATCQGCGEQFVTQPQRAKEGRDKFCSRGCFAHNRHLIAKPLEERFWKHVRKTDACWLWTAYKDEHGYGYIATGTGSKPMRARRVSWELHYGPVPDGKEVLLTCDDPSCVCPDHLILGTAFDRVRLAVERGHTTRGRGKKLSEDVVRAIRTRYAAGGTTQQQLSQEYGVNQATVSEIIRHLIWSHID